MSSEKIESATRRIGHKGPYRMGEVFPGERVSVRDSDGWVVAEATAQEFAERIVAALNSALSQSRSIDAHNDHPLRHFDRTCPACIEGARTDVHTISAESVASSISRKDAVTLFCEIANRRLTDAECFNLTENMRLAITEFAQALTAPSAIERKDKP